MYTSNALFRSICKALKSYVSIKGITRDINVNNCLARENFLAATVPMRTEAFNSIENIRPQFNLIELYAVMLLWIEILMLIAA
jgi:hypothetical protein